MLVVQCEMVSNNVLNDVSKCYYVAEMDENKYQYQWIFMENKMNDDDEIDMILLVHALLASVVMAAACGGLWAALLMAARSHICRVNICTSQLFLKFLYKNGRIYLKFLPVA
jgi:hypothetical protein